MRGVRCHVLGGRANQRGNVVHENGPLCHQAQLWRRSLLVVVTGANRGIGLQLCRQLAARGDRPVAICRKSSPELEELRKQREANEKRLAAFNSLNEKLAALIDAGELEVSMRNGLPVIALPSEVLFGSGKAELAKKGEKALTKVGALLAEMPSQRIQVVGHTDNMPIGEKLEWTDNWELSAARALTVTRFLIAQKVAPTNLSAAGNGEFDPVASNESGNGRKKNRRIELILLPDLSELAPVEAAP